MSAVTPNTAPAFLSLATVMQTSSANKQASAPVNQTAVSQVLVTSATQPASSLSSSQNSTTYLAQSVSQDENILGVVGIATESAQFTPAVQYDQLVADSFIKYKPSYAGLPENTIISASAVSSAYQAKPEVVSASVNVEG